MSLLLKAFLLSVELTSQNILLWSVIKKKSSVLLVLTSSVLLVSKLISSGVTCSALATFSWMVEIAVLSFFYLNKLFQTMAGNVLSVEIYPQIGNILICPANLVQCCVFPLCYFNAVNFYYLFHFVLLQKVRIMLLVAPLVIYEELFPLIVCGINNKECAVHNAQTALSQHTIARFFVSCYWRFWCWQLWWWWWWWWWWYN